MSLSRLIVSLSLHTFSYSATTASYCPLRSDPTGKYFSGNKAKYRKQVEELKRQIEILNEDVIESDKQRESDKNESCAAFQCDNQRLSGIIREHEQTIKEFKEGLARKNNQLEQQEATIIKLKQEIEDNKFLLEQKAIQVKAEFNCISFCFSSLSILSISIFLSSITFPLSV
jgi:hypothetical protein